jgi:hypothetical protein
MVKFDLLSKIPPKEESDESTKNLLVWNINDEKEVYLTEGVTYTPNEIGDAMYTLDNGKKINGTFFNYILVEDIYHMKGGKRKTSKTKRKSNTYTRRTNKAKRTKSKTPKSKRKTYE